MRPEIEAALVRHLKRAQRIYLFAAMSIGIIVTNVSRRSDVEERHYACYCFSSVAFACHAHERRWGAPLRATIDSVHVVDNRFVSNPISTITPSHEEIELAERTMFDMVNALSSR